jgi:hypothetical protein
MQKDSAEQSEKQSLDAAPSASRVLLDHVADIFKDVAQSRFTIGKHKSISEQALIPEGLSDGARFAVEVGDLAQDLDSKTRGEPTHHFDDDTLLGSANGLEQSQAKLNKLIAKSDLSDDDAVQILREFGQRLHTMQDFYAHSNYIEHSLQANPNLRPAQIPLMNFADIKNGNAGAIHTGFYYYENSLQNEQIEFFLGRSGTISKLEALQMKIPGTEYLPSSAYAKLDSFEKRLDYANDKRYSVLHSDLNKDDDESDEGKLINPNTKINLHEYARQMAVRETQHQWSEFEDAVHKVHGQNEGDKILEQIKNISFSSSSLRSLRHSIDGIVTWIS